MAGCETLYLRHPQTMPRRGRRKAASGLPSLRSTRPAHSGGRVSIAHGPDEPVQPWSGQSHARAVRQTGGRRACRGETRPGTPVRPCLSACVSRSIRLPAIPRRSLCSTRPPRGSSHPMDRPAGRRNWRRHPPWPRTDAISGRTPNTRPGACPTPRRRPWREHRSTALVGRPTAPPSPHTEARPCPRPTPSRCAAPQAP